MIKCIQESFSYLMFNYQEKITNKHLNNFIYNENICLEQRLSGTIKTEFVPRLRPD